MQKYKGKKLTYGKCAKRILAFYELATIAETKEGMNWYLEANTYANKLASRFNISVSQSVGIIAVFSPQTDWAQNKQFALTFLLNPNKQVKSRVQYDKALNILALDNEADIFNALALGNGALKTKAFFLNILNPDVPLDVTIDRHAMAICIQSVDKVRAMADNMAKITPIQYTFFRECYKRASKTVGIQAHELQAITWGVYRRLRELPEHKEIQPF